jgi:type I restriction enzyme, S subunit
MERVVKLEDSEGANPATMSDFPVLAESLQGTFKETELGPLPDDWAVSSIAESCYRPEYGYTASAEKEPVGPRFLRITDIQERGVEWETVPYCRCDEDTKRKHRLRPADLLFARIGATTGKSFLVRSCPEAVYASYLIRVRAKEVDPDFLYYFCNSEMYWKQINANKGDKLKGGVSGSLLAQVRHCLPPPPEQRAIAAVLSKIQAAVNVQEKIVATLKELKAATMAKLFREGLRGEHLKQTEIGEIPESWETTPLGNIAQVSTGTTPSTTDADYYVGDIPFVKTAEIDNNIIIRTQNYISQRAVQDYNLRIYPAGSVFLAMYGQGKTRGRAALLGIPAATTQNTAAIEPSPALNGEFLWHYLLSQYEALRGIGNLGHLSHLNLGYVKELLIPVPPIEEQIQIKAVFSRLQDRAEAANRRYLGLNRLFSSTLHLLMTGQVRVNHAVLPEAKA